jgi:hypothetical protein
MRPTVALRPLLGPPTAPPLPVTALRMQRSLAWPIGQVEAELPLTTTPPDAGTLMLLTAQADSPGAPTPIFTGAVLRVEQGSTAIRLVLEEATGPLARLRVNTVYRSTTAAAVIQGLAAQAKVKAAVAGPGAQFPVYNVLATRSAMDHIVELALLSGFRIFTDTTGTLRAVPINPPVPAPGPSLGPDAGAVVGFAAAASAAEPPVATVIGEGAFSRQGPGAESWVLKDASALTDGSGPTVLNLPALKTPADVKTAAAARTSRLKEAAAERHLTLLGPPPADLGAEVTLQGFAAGNGRARVAGIAMLWHVQTGLQTHLTLHGLG